MSDAPKFCRDCKWMRVGVFQPRINAKCAHPSIINLVTGAADAYCSTQRIYGAADKCGKQGKLWEPK